MFKKIILGLINKIFGLRLTIEQLDAFFAFIQMLVEVFGSVTEAASFVRRTESKARSVGRVKAKVIFTGMEKTMGEA